MAKMFQDYCQQNTHQILSFWTSNTDLLDAYIMNWVQTGTNPPCYQKKPSLSLKNLLTLLQAT